MLEIIGWLLGHVGSIGPEGLSLATIVVTVQLEGVVPANWNATERAKDFARRVADECQMWLGEPANANPVFHLNVSDGTVDDDLIGPETT